MQRVALAAQTRRHAARWRLCWWGLLPLWWARVLRWRLGGEEGGESPPLRLHGRTLSRTCCDHQNGCRTFSRREWRGHTDTPLPPAWGRRGHGHRRSNGSSGRSACTQGTRISSHGGCATTYTNTQLCARTSRYTASGIHAQVRPPDHHDFIPSHTREELPLAIKPRIIHTLTVPVQCVHQTTFP